MTEENINVLLVDDHKMVRQGLIFFLSSQPGIVVLGEASTAGEAVTLANELQPDVILMDIVLPDKSGNEAIANILATSPHINIIALSSFVDEEKVRSAIEAGAAGYLMKDIDPIELANAIRATQRGELYLHPEAAQLLAEILRPSTPENQEPSPDILTAREQEVLVLITQGLSNQDIAKSLNITLKTTKAHVSNILQKLRLESRVQAALYALRHRLVRIDEI